jgi:hypothetical protein
MNILKPGPAAVAATANMKRKPMVATRAAAAAKEARVAT